MKLNYGYVLIALIFIIVTFSERTAPEGIYVLLLCAACICLQLDKRSISRIEIELNTDTLADKIAKKLKKESS